MQASAEARCSASELAGVKAIGLGLPSGPPGALFVFVQSLLQDVLVVRDAPKLLQAEQQ